MNSELLIFNFVGANMSHITWQIYSCSRNVDTASGGPSPYLTSFHKTCQFSKDHLGLRSFFSLVKGGPLRQCENLMQNVCMYMAAKTLENVFEVEAYICTAPLQRLCL